MEIKKQPVASKLNDIEEHLMGCEEKDDYELERKGKRDS